MPIPTLYGQRNSRAVNQQSIVEFWWALCGAEGSRIEESIQESYLLAKILPHARSNGSRRVFVDSIEIVPEGRREQLNAWIAELDQRLSDSRSCEFDEEEFRDATAGLIGPPNYDDNVWERYTEMKDALFQEAKEAICQAGPEAINSVLEKWKALRKSIGRRKGNAVEKQVLDILSYECRAALHRCYSEVWRFLLPALGEWYGMSDESYIFHQLWHFDRCRASDHGDQAYFHLFHGHIFGLHPACGPVLLTRCGGELFGDWLQEGSLRSYHRVLHALAVAIGYYGERHGIASLLRRRDGTIQTVSDMAALEEQQHDQALGRRSYQLDD